jgi:NAD(P)-dependent dehydrogenase (short-subunit alcohol dehydrogenase family)
MSELIMITGATGGLGRAVLARAGVAGWLPVLVSRESDRLADLGTSPDVLTVEADVATPGGAELALSACRDRYGRPPDVLVNCAGSTLLAPLHRTRPEQYRDCLSANLDSAFYSLGAYVQSLLDAKQPGAAVLVSSVVARIGVPNHEAIAAAKAGVEGLVRSAAATYGGQGIRVNGVAPGIMRTGATERLFANEQAEKAIAAQYPLGRYGTADDLAAAVLWLASPEASWVTGQVLAVDGGFTSVRPTIRR